jgi:hypothetical protein
MNVCRSRWQCGLERMSAATRLLGLRVRIQQRAWMSVPCHAVCRAGSGLCDELITRSEEFYRSYVCVIVCDIETSTIRRPLVQLGLLRQKKMNL